MSPRRSRRPPIRNLQSAMCNYFVTFAMYEPCFLNTRVGENSPSLWPTMFSVTKTELNVLPLCTRNVWPTKSGVTIERLDQVLIGFLTPDEFILSIFSRRCDSTKGPFFNDLAIKCQISCHPERSRGIAMNNLSLMQRDSRLRCASLGMTEAKLSSSAFSFPK